jgi:hypothetical protein
MAFFAASQYAEQYFSPCGAMHKQPFIAHFLGSAAIAKPS